MRGLIAWSCAGVNDVPIFWLGVEKVGGEAGCFVLEYEMAFLVGWESGEVGCCWEGDEVWYMDVNVDDLRRRV